MSDTQDVVAEARSSFDLSARLRGRSLRTAKIVVYTDEVTALKIQDADRKLQQLTDINANLGGLADLAKELELPEVEESLRTIARSGIRDMDEYERLEAEKEDLTAELKATALEIEIQALPQIIIKDCRRQAKKRLGIKGNIPEDRMEEFTDLVTAIALSKAITRVTDRASSESSSAVTVEEAKSFQDFLPNSEFGKIDQKLADLNYTDVFSGTVTDDADF